VTSLPGRLLEVPAELEPLRLAEAFLLLEEGEEAVGALETSARFGVAPAEERAALEERARAIRAPLRTPPSGPARPLDEPSGTPAARETE
jgi:hypothetical protein